MITAHLTVTIESRATGNRIEDISACLEALAEELRDSGPAIQDRVSDTITVGESEINFTLVLLPEISSS